MPGSGTARAKSKTVKVPDLAITQSGPGHKFMLDGKYELTLIPVNCPPERVIEFVGLLRKAWNAYANK